MVTAPISIPRPSYRGCKCVKQIKNVEMHRIADDLERYINKCIRNQTPRNRVYNYHEIADATGYDVKVVRDLCFALAAGHNGFIGVNLDFYE